MPQLYVALLVVQLPLEGASMQEKVQLQSLLLGISCYVMWGFFPLYFALLRPAGAVEVIVYRAVWGLATCILAVGVLRRFSRLKLLLSDRAACLRLFVAGWLIVVNWSVYVYAIQNGHTIDASIGYFINPLVTIALARFVLGEHLSRPQIFAIALGVVAVIVLVVGNGRLPWISLALAFTFGFYSLVKKKVAHRVGALEGMTIETAAVAPALLAYLIYLCAHGQSSFQHLVATGASGAQIALHGLLLLGAGVLTVIPLLVFAKSAEGLPLAVLGLIQYCGPILQLIIGITVFHEPMSSTRWIGAGIIWCALLVLSADGLRRLHIASRIASFARKK